MTAPKPEFDLDELDRLDAERRETGRWMHFALSLVEAWPAVSKRMRELEAIVCPPKLWEDMIRERTERAESAEARVKELEASIARLHSFAGRGDGHGSLEATEACLADTFTMLRIDYDNAEKDAKSAEARVRELEESLYRQVCRAEVAENRITSLESELAEARLDLERWHTSVEAHRLATILEQRDEARAEAKALESEVARLREEVGLEQAVRAALGDRFESLSLTQCGTRGARQWEAEWWGSDEEAHAFDNLRVTGETLPALLRAILEVEAKS